MPASIVRRCGGSSCAVRSSLSSRSQSGQQVVVSGCVRLWPAATSRTRGPGADGGALICGAVTKRSLRALPAKLSAGVGGVLPAPGPDRQVRGGEQDQCRHDQHRAGDAASKRHVYVYVDHEHCWPPPRPAPSPPGPGIVRQAARPHVLRASTASPAMITRMPGRQHHHRQPDREQRSTQNGHREPLHYVHPAGQPGSHARAARGHCPLPAPEPAAPARTSTAAAVRAPTGSASPTSRP